MKESQNSSHNIDEVEIVEPLNNPNESGVTATFNQQNNYHLSSNIDLDKLSLLSNKAPELGDRVMKLYEKQQQHNISMDKRIIKLEEIEQETRITERPYQRKFAFKALNFAMVLSIFSLGTAAFFAYLGHTVLASIAITIPIGVGVANILGFRAASQKSDNKKDTKEELED